MQILTTIQDTKNYLISLRKKGDTIGFVPTMGALHNGHISLLESAKRENDIVVASIFVNPLQFNDKKDLEKYPRTLEHDIEKLKSAQCDVVFTPSAKEMYPEAHPQPLPLGGEKSKSQVLPNGEDLRGAFDLGMLDKVMEGAHRPGHFQGVCVVVKKLFDIVEPTKAYFGEKDFQQLAIIEHMVKTLNIPVEIIPCPTVRETDGLAMSSRNALLTADERKNAAHIYKTLVDVKDTKGTIIQIKKWVANQINSNPFMQLEYFEIVNAETLMPYNSINEAKQLRACIAVKVGAVRLIDNIPF